MTKEKHSSEKLPQRVYERLGVWQRNLRKLTSLVPGRKLPLLTPAESHGPDLERFQDRSQALISWRDKQAQSWLFSGNLYTDRGRGYSFELLFVDRRLQNDFFGALPARWVLPRAISVQFSITDALNADAARVFRSWRKGGVLSRQPGFASDERFHLECGGWAAYLTPEKAISISAQGSTGESLRLTLAPKKEAIYHGLSGYSQLGTLSHEASFYCSLTRLEAKGQLLVDDKLEDVTGWVWLDHEKATSPSGESEHSWDRVTLQLSTGDDLMLYLLDDNSFGTWIDSQARVKHLVRSEIKLENLEHWISPETGARYPVKRKIRIEPLGLDLDLRSSVAHQELNAKHTSFSSRWAGSVSADGMLSGTKVEARGHMVINGRDPRPRARIVDFLLKN
jgi:predicted secreted hydrolase